MEVDNSPQTGEESQEVPFYSVLWFSLCSILNYRCFSEFTREVKKRQSVWGRRRRRRVRKGLDRVNVDDYLMIGHSYTNTYLQLLFDLNNLFRAYFVKHSKPMEFVHRQFTSSPRWTRYWNTIVISWGGGEQERIVRLLRKTRTLLWNCWIQLIAKLGSRRESNIWVALLGIFR